MDKYISKVICVTHDKENVYGRAYFPQTEGRHPAVIMSHGFNGSHKDFDHFGRFFASNGIVTYCYDFCGGSVNSMSSMRTDEMTIFTEKEDLKAVIAEVRSWKEVDDQRIFLIGGSQGGFVTALTAEELMDKVQGEILMYPAFCIPDDWTNRYQSIKDIPKQAGLWGMIIGEHFIKSIYGFDLKEHFGKFNQRVLIVHGDKDPVVSPQYSINMGKLYPHAEVVILPGEGHGFTRDGDQKVMEMTLDYIKS